MLRALVLLLVLANALTWAYGRGYLGTMGWGRAEQREPHRLSQQIEPERIRLVDGNRSAESSETQPATVPAVSSESLPETRPR